MLNILKIFLIIIMIGAALPADAFAEDSTQNAPLISSKNIQAVPIALEGTDVVTYFSIDGPQQGQETYQAMYNDKRYFFTSAENQAIFAANPTQYLPEFGEYCGCGVSDNRRVIADPKVFKIVNGKLVLFENEDVLSEWNENEAERYQQAQKYWKYEDEYKAEDRLRNEGKVRLFKF